MGAQLIIPYSGDELSSSADIWLTAEQADSPDGGRLTSDQLRSMLSYARAGISATATLVDRCPVAITDSTVRITLRLNVFPSSPTLPYTISPAYGSVGPQVREVLVDRSFDLLFEMRREVDRQLLIDPSTLASPWVSPCFAEGLRPITGPVITWQGGRFVVDQPVFGIAAVSCQSVGWQHDIVMEIERVHGQKIIDIANVVTVTWHDGSQYQSTVVSMACPPCVEQILNACGQGDLAAIGRRDPTATRVTVWVSECSGDQLKKEIIPPDPEVTNG